VVLKMCPRVSPKPENPENVAQAVVGVLSATVIWVTAGRQPAGARDVCPVGATIGCHRDGAVATPRVDRRGLRRRDTNS
jgi:hypothetical protein